jgi:hypothetical protein
MLERCQSRGFASVNTDRLGAVPLGHALVRTTFPDRTRAEVRRADLLVLPRYVVATAASVVALILGTLRAWYGITLLFRSVNFRALAGGSG